MHLNTIRSGARIKKTRVGRGTSSGGRTAGRGDKGQKARRNMGLGFEGGQMPLQRRLPKVGFRSALARHTAALRTSELNQLETEVISFASLSAAGLIRHDKTRVRVYLSGEITKAFRVQADVKVSAGAKAAIEAAGGTIEG